MMTLEEKQVVYDRAVAASKMPPAHRYSQEAVYTENLSSFAIANEVETRAMISYFVPVLVQIVKADLDGVGSVFNEVVPFGLDLNYGVYYSRLSALLPLLSFMAGSEPPPVLDPLKNEFPFIQQFDEYGDSAVIGPGQSALLVSVEGLKMEADVQATVHLHPRLTQLGLISSPIFIRGNDAPHEPKSIQMVVFNSNPISSVRIYKQQGCFAVTFAVKSLLKSGGSED